MCLLMIDRMIFLKYSINYNVWSMRLYFMYYEKMFLLSSGLDRNGGFDMWVRFIADKLKVIKGKGIDIFYIGIDVHHR